MFVRIANESGPVNRLFLEKLGVSTKRDDDATIGQFGSGSKFAPIAALRREWSWLNVGFDDSGDYEMHYECDDSSGLNEIFFVYGDGTRKDSSYTLEAGVLSWEASFQIVREALSNAIDENISSGARWWWEVVEEPVYQEGVFSVYLRDETTLRPPIEVMEVLENFDSYYSVNRDPLFADSYSKIFERVDGDVGVVYSKGVRVHYFDDPSEEYTPLFDYEFFSIELNEERRVRNEMDADRLVADIWSRVDDIGLIKRFIRNANTSYELNRGAYTYLWRTYRNDSWVEAWNDLYGPEFVPVDEYVTSFIRTRLNSFGFKPVVVPVSLVHLLDGVDGIHSVKSALANYEHDFLDLSPEQEDRISRALGMIERAGITIPFEIKVFDPLDSKQEKIWGIAKDNSILLNKAILEPGRLDDLIGTIIHENDHIRTGLGDDDEAFRHIADNLIGTLIVNNYA